MKVSVIINNCNYANYCCQSISSLLSLNYKPYEIIFVDDGSQDDSLRKISNFANQIEVIKKNNEGQYSCYNVGFELAKGDWITFLDSDDFYINEFFGLASNLLTKKTSKFQCACQFVDEKGLFLPHFFPNFSQSTNPKNILKWYKKTASYPTPPGSGNIYRKAFLSDFFPLDVQWKNEADGPLLAASPFYGDVVTIKTPCVAYRNHGKNDCLMQTLKVGNIRREVIRANKRFAFGIKVADRKGLKIDPLSINRGLSYLQYRATSFFLDKRNHPIKDRATYIIKDAFLSIFTNQQYTFKARSLLFFYIMFLFLIPPLRFYISELRFVPGKRSRWMVIFSKFIGLTN